MTHEDVLEEVDAQFLEGWRKAKGAHLTLTINPLTGLENTIEKMFEEWGWDQIDHDVLLPFVSDREKYDELEAKKASGEALSLEEAPLYNRLQNRALGQYGRKISDEIKLRHGL